MVNAVKVTVISQRSETELDFFRYINPEPALEVCFIQCAAISCMHGAVNARMICD